jgi:excisionase family DNA binding protein
MNGAASTTGYLKREYEGNRLGGMAEEPKYYTTQEAADELGVDPAHIRRLCGTGELRATKFGPVWMIERESLEAVRDAAPTGRPRGSKTSKPTSEG